MKKYWERTPKWIQALIWFIVLLYPIVIINQAAIVQNLQSYNTVPWAFLFCLTTLWLFWEYSTGRDNIFKKSLVRKDLSCTTPSKYVSLATQTLISVFLFAFVYSANAIGFGLFGTEETSQLEFIKYMGSAPGITGPLLLMGAALTAGIVEEVVFRGYMQSILTANYGRVISFIAVGIVFTIGHLLPPSLYLQYFAVSIAFSWVADRIGSVLPGIIVHILFDAIAFGTVYFSLTASDPHYLSQLLPINTFILLVSIAGIVYIGLKITQQDNLIDDKI